MDPRFTLAKAGLFNLATPCLLWSGVVVGTVVEARAKFNAKSLTKKVGLDVGRSVFYAISRVEMGLATMSAVICALQRTPAVPMAFLNVAVMTFVAQNFYLRPKLSERTQQIIDGKDIPKSNLHAIYVILELLKFTSLLCAAHTSL